MAKGGLVYFPLDVALDDKFELIEAEFGLTGFAVIVKLFQKIYGDQGYYCEWTNEVALLFAKSIGLGVSVVSEIVSASIKRGIFSQELYDKYHILTSKGIQDRYFEAVIRRKKVEVKKEYLLLNHALNLKNVVISSENVNIFPKNADISKQRKVKESKEKESKGEEGKTAVADFYEQNIGVLSRTISDDMDYYLSNGFEPELIILCIKKSVDNNKRTWSYAKAIINSLSNQGIKTVKDWNAKDKFSKKQVSQSHSYNMDEFDKLGYDIPEV
mgnify:FL=1